MSIVCAFYDCVLTRIVTKNKNAMKQRHKLKLVS